MKSRLVTHLRSLSGILLEVLFPTSCVGCRASGTSLCQSCASRIKESPGTLGPDIISLYNYHDATLKRMLWDYKFLGKKYLAGDLASLMYDGVLELISDIYSIDAFDDVILTSVPGSATRVKQRGYDQGVELRRALVAKDHAGIFTSTKTLLTRDKNSHPQTDIANREKRIQNIRGAFAAQTKSIDSIKDRNIVLIDDVTTTGATLLEAQEVLLNAGAKRVLCVSLSH